jgi:hypothetical protein
MGGEVTKVEAMRLLAEKGKNAAALAEALFPRAELSGEVLVKASQLAGEAKAYADAILILRAVEL